MTVWAATKAKAQFSTVLDGAETQGPQRIQRRKKSYILLTEEQFLAHKQTATTKPEPFVGAWTAMQPSFKARYDSDFPRLTLKLRSLDLG